MLAHIEYEAGGLLINCAAASIRAPAPGTTMATLNRLHCEAGAEQVAHIN